MSSNMRLPGVMGSRIAGYVHTLLTIMCACACLSLPVGAAAASGDAVSTAVYLRAATGFARAQTVNLNASAAAMNHEASGIAMGCPLVLVGAPKSVQFIAVAAEVYSAVLYAGAVPDRMAALAFSGKIAALHWGNRGVAKLVRALASEERATVKLVMPNVCADLIEWKTSGYRTLSSGTESFMAAVEAIKQKIKGHGGQEESLEKAVLKRLRPYETPADQKLAKGLKRLNEAGGERLLSVYANALGLLSKTLGLEPS